MNRRIDWDDLRFVLAVADRGSLAGGARALGVNHTTVLRRINAFEEKLGLRLFDRLPTGYVLTAGGEELMAAARRIDDTVAGLERTLAGQDLKLSGTLRVTTTDTLMASLLPEVIAGFRAVHPRIVVEIAVSNAHFTLTRRDADVAVRPAAAVPETLVGRNVGVVAAAVYAAPLYLERNPPDGTPDDGHAWLAPDDSLSATAIGRWMRRVPEERIAARADSLVALRDLALTGLGLTALPCYLGDASPGLQRVAGPLPEAETALWVLTHEHLRHTARVRAFTDFAASAFGERRALLAGR